MSNAQSSSLPQGKTCPKVVLHKVIVEHFGLSLKWSHCLSALSCPSQYRQRVYKQRTSRRTFYQRATDIESGLLNSTSRNVQRTETWMLGTHETLPALRHCQCSGLWYVDLDSKSDFSKRERTGFPINTQPGSADWIPAQQSALRQTRCHPVCSLVVILRHGGF